MNERQGGGTEGREMRPDIGLGHCGVYWRGIRLAWEPKLGGREAPGVGYLIRRGGRRQMSGALGEGSQPLRRVEG